MSSIPPNSPWRGCAANFPQPIREEDVREAQRLTRIVHSLNCVVPRPDSVNPTLANIIYRSGDGERDVTRHVFRWDDAPFDRVFENGFQARPQGDTPDLIYYNLTQYVLHGGLPLDPERTTIHPFVGTTLNSQWRPTYTLRPGEERRVYRYEIYAPGGIWVAQTLGDQYGRYRRQDEVCFVAGIAPQYIRSAQLFIATGQAGSWHPTWRRAETAIIVNGRFNPQSLDDIEGPIFDYLDKDINRRRPLTIRVIRPQLPQSESHGRREKRQVPSDAPSHWYARAVADIPSYINAAFRSSITNEACHFMKNEYVRLNYAPGTTNDKIIFGPVLICEGYPSLIGTAFGEHGIDCAFDSGGNTAFIFSGNLCAYIDYAPGTPYDKILKGPMTITAMFPFFKGTVFENAIDTAFRSSVINEAYLFKGDQYALINYGSKYLIAVRKITQGFYSLRNTIFASGIDAAFASHRKNEAYIFKGDQFALINFAPATTDDYIIGGVKPIFPNWPSLRSILPRKNRGLDVHDHHNHAQANRDHVHDEL